MKIGSKGAKLYSVCLKFLILFCLTQQAFAFINIESVRKIKGEGYVGRSSLQGTGQMGNTDKFTSQFSTTGAYRFEKNELLYLANYKYGTSFDIKDTNQGSAHLRHTWGYSNPLAYELFVQTEFDEFKELNSRNYIGGNLRFRVSSVEDHLVYIGLGSFYEVEDFVGDRDERGFRGNLYLSQMHNITKSTTFYATLYYQPRLEEPNIYRVRLQSGMDTKLTEVLTLSLSFNLSHDTGLPADVKETDADYLVGFTMAY